MKILLSCLLLLPSLMHAADLRALGKSSATISVLNMQPVPLVSSANKNGWARIPAFFSNNGATIFTPTASTNGVADIEVKADGYLFLACNWDYQGNQSGNWEKKSWTEKNFKSKGWDQLSKKDLGGDLVKNDNRAQTIFFKRVKKGENLRLRCNKYDPPYPILLTSKP
ncbi:MAG: hypothetical protein NTY98_13490 [Verrucomicrobia bacterium]|nr:hypothetical protein [Verrucomicrobiota bacterium]